MQRKLGLFGASGVGVGAIVGGGILALAGVAFSTAGPAAIAAFAINGVIAMFTALSFAEMASKFPESGGTYTFSKKVLSVEAAFVIGWMVWFASIVAAVLYAFGFAYFTLVLIGDLLSAVGWGPFAILEKDVARTALAIITCLLLGVALARKPAGGGAWINVVKVAVFGVLIAGGLWALAGKPTSTTLANLQPFFTEGFAGLIAAMGYTFIALQGFDLIAAVGGEIKDPARNLPRAMIISLGIALAIYLPFLFVIATAGVGPGESISELARNDPEGIVAVAARLFLGDFGYWLVIVAAVLSMFSALQANLFAASRIAAAMAQDRTLPSRLAGISKRRSTPVYAISATVGLVCLIALVVPDVAAAGAASSLMFLITFALAHAIAILVRRRSLLSPPPFRTPWFPAIPAIGGLACLGLAVFQGIVVPTAGLIALGWVVMGTILFLCLFARRARVRDATRSAIHPELLSLRGRRPLVLVPIANPQNAEAMMTLASALVPSGVGRVLLHNVIVTPPRWSVMEDLAPLDRSQEVMRHLLETSARLGQRSEALTTFGNHPIHEIARVARLHQCHSVVLGLTHLTDDTDIDRLESMFGSIHSDVIVMRAAPDWTPLSSRRILIPVAGRGGHESLLARIVGSLARHHELNLTYLTVLPENSKQSAVARYRRLLQMLADDQSHQDGSSADGSKMLTHFQIVRSDDPFATIADFAAAHDLIFLGAQRSGRKTNVFGKFTLRLAQAVNTPLIVISRGS